MSNIDYQRYLKYKSKYEAFKKLNQKNMIGGEYINLPLEVLDIFNQHIGVCWADAAITALFLSDGGREILWPEIFKFTQEEYHEHEFIVPRQLKTFEENQVLNRYIVLLELIRKSIEVSYDRYNVHIINAHKKRTNYIQRCDKAINDMICGMDWVLCNANDKYGYMAKESGKFQKIGGLGGYSHILVEKLIEGFPGKVSLHNISTPLDKFNMNWSRGVQLVAQMREHIYDRKNRSDGAYLFSFNRDSELTGHAVCVIKINGKWSVFDNDATTSGKSTFVSVEGGRRNIPDFLLKLYNLGNGENAGNFFAIKFNMNRPLEPEIIDRSELSYNPFNKTYNMYNNFINSLSPLGKIWVQVMQSYDKDAFTHLFYGKQNFFMDTSALEIDFTPEVEILVENALDNIKNNHVLTKNAIRIKFKNNVMIESGIHEIPFDDFRLNDSIVRWYKNGEIHRDGYKLAVLYKNGGYEWWKNGKRHCNNDIPAYSALDYSSNPSNSTDEKHIINEWWVNGIMKRDDPELPQMTDHVTVKDNQEMIIDDYTVKAWYKDNIHHREDKPAIVMEPGNGEEWWVNGKCHREGGLPAVTLRDGSQEWWVDNKRHRDDDLPAIDRKDGMQQWWIYDKHHREGGKPAVIFSDGSQEWWIDGKRHRSNNLPAVDRKDGDKEWWVNGKRHREGDKPAIERKNKTQEWYKNGKRHRDGDLPSIITSDGMREWWVNGKIHRDNNLPTIENKNIQGWIYITNTEDENGEIQEIRSFHRNNDEPAIIGKLYDIKEWYKNGERHRDEDKPAVICNHKWLPRREWWFDGEPHRNKMNGPAIVYPKEHIEEYWEKGLFLYAINSHTRKKIPNHSPFEMSKKYYIDHWA